MREALIAARAICSVSDSPHGIWESLPAQTDPNATASKILQQWSTAQRIESERLVQALAAAISGLSPQHALRVLDVHRKGSSPASG